MSPRTVLALGLAGLLAAAAAGPAGAAPKPKPKPKPKPITKTYPATAFPADPTTLEGTVCQPLLPGAAHLTPLRLPAAGTLDVRLTGYVGDWSLGIRDKNGANLTDSDQSDLADDGVEQAVLKVRGPLDVTIAACNFVGGPTGSVTYTFTYA